MYSRRHSTLVLHRWRVRDPLTGRWRATRYVATEEEISRKYERYEVIPGTREEREVDPEKALTAGHVQRGFGQKD